MVECPSCDRDDFKSVGGMKAHHAQVHGESIAGELHTCPHCGDEFRVVQGHRKDRDGMKFCSRECYAEYQSDGTRTYDCDTCGESFERQEKLFEGDPPHYCSVECYGKASQNRVVLECDECGDEFERAVSKDKPGHTYCSNGCFHTARRMRPPTLYRALRDRLADRTWKYISSDATEDARCEMCGADTCDNGRALETHHIVPLMAGGAHHEDNLMVLCDRCHRFAETFTTNRIDYPIMELIQMEMDT